MGQVTVTPATLQAAAPAVRQLGSGIADLGAAVDGVVQGAEAACATAVLADALFLFRARWAQSLVTVGGGIQAIGLELSAAGTSYTSNDLGVAGQFTGGH